MASSGCSEEGLPQIIDERKLKRKISNRESARRSRLRKQKLQDDLTQLMNKLMEENYQIITNMNITTQLYLNLETENSILMAQKAEISHRLLYLTEIIYYMNSSTGGLVVTEHADQYGFNCWSSTFVNQPISAMAMADVFKN